jgi:hypothetical protein
MPRQWAKIIATMENDDSGIGFPEIFLKFEVSSQKITIRPFTNVSRPNKSICIGTL